MLILVLLIVAAILFFLAGVGGVPSGRVNLIALGLFFWVLTVIIPKL
jgi:hypothetical protein